MTNEQVLELKLQAISTKMQREIKKDLFWNQFTSGMKGGESEESNNPKDKFLRDPIYVEDAIQKGRLGHMAKIPMTLNLSGPATYGSTAMTGREEPMSRLWTEVYVNAVKHGVIVEEGAMETFNERALNAALDAVPLETYWHACMENWNVVSSIYEGLSENLTVAKGDEVYGDGMGLAKRYHPNLFKWTGAADASGALSRVGTAKKFPTATQVYNAANTSTNQLPFSTYTIEAARTQALKQGMKPLAGDNGLKFFPWVISPEQARSLRADAKFQATMNSPAWKDIKDHPMVKGAIGHYLGFVFFEDTWGILVRGFSGTGAGDLNILGSVQMVYDDEKQNPRFLPQEGLIGYTSGKYNQVSVIFGQHFIGEALGEAATFKYREEDYGDWKGLRCKAIYGMNRMDFVPPNQIDNLISSPTSITNVYNRSSMLVMTFENVVSL